jgi:M6 family metalloprotease-like protein
VQQKLWQLPLSYVKPFKQTMFILTDGGRELKQASIIMLLLLISTTISYFPTLIQVNGAQTGWTQLYLLPGAKYCSPGSLIQTSDNGYALIVLGSQSENDGYDVGRLIKMNSNFKIQWNIDTNLASPLPSLSVLQTLDGGLLFHADDRLIKLDNLGNVIWNYSFSKWTNSDSFWAFTNIVSTIQTDDGGFVIGGLQPSDSQHADAWLEKINSYGEVQWSKTYPLPSSTYSYVESLVQLSDGSYVFACQGLGNDISNSNYYLIKTDSSGTEKWKVEYPDTQNVSLTSVLKTSDGGFAIGGFVNNFSNYEPNYIDGENVWLMKVSSTGLQQWNRTYGGPKEDLALPSFVTSDNGIIFGGVTYSFGFGNPDAWLFKVDSSGNIVMSKTYGWSDKFTATWDRVLQTSDGGYVMPIRTNYTAPEGSFGLMKTDSAGATTLIPSTSTVPEPKQFPPVVNVKVAVIFAKFSDNNPAPTRTANDYLIGINSFVSRLQRYNSGNSYGQLNLQFSFFNQSNGNWKYTVDHDRLYYSSRPQQFTEDCIKKADNDVNFNSFDIVICVHSGSDWTVSQNLDDMRRQYFYQQFTTPDGDVVKNRIVISEIGPESIWVGLYAHEIGHAIGKIETGNFLPDRYSEQGNGEVYGWDLMASGDFWLPNPIQMSTYSKSYLGWITPQIRGYGTYEICNLESLSFKDTENTLKFYPLGLSTGPWYYLAEARSDYYPYSSDWHAPDSGIELYVVKPYSGKNPPLTDAVDRISNPNHADTQSRLYCTLRTQGDSYLDPFAMLNFTYIQPANAYRENGLYQDLSVTPYNPINLIGARLAQLLPSVQSGVGSINGSLPPDLDLHAYTPDGKHVGINYVTGQFENQIPGAIASGDLVSSDEWILVPTGTQVTYKVSSHDVGEFLRQEPQLSSQFQSLALNVTNLGFDSKGAAYNISNQTYNISPNSIIEVVSNGTAPTPTPPPAIPEIPLPITLLTALGATLAFASAKTILLKRKKWHSQHAS